MNIPVRERTRPDEPECRSLRRARWRITARIAVVMSAVLLLIGVLIYTVMIAAQHSDVRRDLDYTAGLSAVDSPPGCTWLTMAHDGRLVSSPGMPAGFPLAAPLASVTSGGPEVQQQVSTAAGTYAVLTTRRGTDVVQVVYDLRYQLEDRDSLLRSIVAAELIGMMGAALAGGLLARRAIAPLSEALFRQRRFVADASHELRTPLTRLHTRAQLLARRADAANLPNRITADLRQLVSGSRELGDVIDDLLRSAELDAAPRPVAPVDMATVAHEVCTAEQARTELAGLTVTTRVDQGDHVVAGVGSALRRVVSALVDNAIGHTAPGGHIEVIVAGGGTGAVSVTVQDDGVGFEPRDAERLFDRHVSGHAGAPRRFGIGLALVREVVASHGGTIAADGEPGVGARFTVTLPAWPTPPTDRRRPVTRSAAPLIPDITV